MENQHQFSHNLNHRIKIGEDIGAFSTYEEPAFLFKEGKTYVAFSDYYEVSPSLAGEIPGEQVFELVPVIAEGFDILSGSKASS